MDNECNEGIIMVGLAFSYERRKATKGMRENDKVAGSVD